MSPLARIFHDSPAATADMTVLPGVLGFRTLRRTVQVRLGSNPLRLPGGTAFNARLDAADTLIYIDLPYSVSYWFVKCRIITFN